jgi:hypothetical protein
VDETRKSAIIALAPWFVENPARCQIDARSLTLMHRCVVNKGCGDDEVKNVQTIYTVKLF